MENSTLSNLIDCIEYGTKLHVSVYFNQRNGFAQLQLEHDKTIHSSNYCNVVKLLPNQFEKCFRCRNVAIKKAIFYKKAYGGYCINGIYEYLYPVIIRQKVFCVVCVGNVYNESNIQQKTNNKDLLVHTQKNVSQHDCHKIASTIAQFIINVVENTTETLDKNDNRLIESLKEYVNKNFTYDIKISHLAKTFHYNEKYVGRIFKKYTGYSFNEYLNITRVKHAKKLLSEGFSATESAIQSGFNNVTYFNRIFKKHYHSTPSKSKTK
jgi:YesN/AraC family two-component response regulator